MGISIRLATCCYIVVFHMMVAVPDPNNSGPDIVLAWFKSSYQLRMDDKKQTEIPVSRAQTTRLRELFGL
jgi:hypothetical protein